MTTTYDPFHPTYFDQNDLRDELTRVFDLCHGCRLCFKFCTAFPSLFEMIDRFDDQDSARLTPAQQDRVVDECFNCKLCYVNCPYIPGQSEWNIDFPRMMLRAKQVRFRDQPRKVSVRLTDQAMGRTDLAGKVNSAAAGLVNKAIGTPGSRTRRLMQAVTGIAAQRVLPPYARTRFSTWFKRRKADGSRGQNRVGSDQAKVALFPTCMVEYQNPAIGQDLVKVFERNGVDCSLPEGQRCCGAPWLHSGDVDNFVRQGRKNLAVLAAAVREGRDIVVPQPTCSYVLKKDYVDYIGGPNAEAVAENTYDTSEYLWKLRKDPGTTMDETFEGDVPEATTYHAPCHLRAQNIGYRSRDLMKLTGTKVTVVAECSAIDGTWGLRAANYEASRQVAQKMVRAIQAAPGDEVTGDCNLANGGIREETGHEPTHPMQFLARAYGIPAERD